MSVIAKEREKIKTRSPLIMSKNYTFNNINIAFYLMFWPFCERWDQSWGEFTFKKIIGVTLVNKIM